MANGGRIDYTIGFQVDKTGLNDFQKTLSEMKNLGAKDENCKQNRQHISLDFCDHSSSIFLSAFRKTGKNDSRMGEDGRRHQSVGKSAG